MMWPDRLLVGWAEASRQTVGSPQERLYRGSWQVILTEGRNLAGGAGNPWAQREAQGLKMMCWEFVLRGQQEQ